MGPDQSLQDTGTKEQSGTGSFQFPSVHYSQPCATALCTQIPPRESWSPNSADITKITGSQAHRRDKIQLDRARPGTTKDNHMTGGKSKNVSNRNQDYLASSEPNSPTTASPGYPNTPEKQDSDLKSHLMMMIEDFKDINNSLKEIQGNTHKQVLKFLKTEIDPNLKWENQVKVHINGEFFKS